MFITVMFGAGCWELVNPWCSLVTLTAHLRQRGQVLPDATVALLGKDGHLVILSKDLEEGASQEPSTGSTLLQERGTYVLVQIINGEDGAPTRYESLLENLEDWCPELAGEYHGRALGWGGSIFSPAPTGRASWVFQRSYAGCRAFPQRATDGGDVPALGVATRSKVLLQGPKGWAPCCPGPASWGQEPGKETWVPGGTVTPRNGVLSQGTDTCVLRGVGSPRTHAHIHERGNILSPETGAQHTAGV
ncbi:uncharacterized protein C22orf15 homolog isoform X1 [Phyllostomus discolor]|uniref:Uncharacterized protein C22orf15 homolog isoform X1 n=1 Tax=Phyllostomus discolor TaxID=89673 RepID=A0A7E6CRX9_9CHIR|nr:uncharacterized protein C22orf15 homolog isoform X1 [Phyllostomus discolor]